MGWFDNFLARRQQEHASKMKISDVEVRECTAMLMCEVLNDKFPKQDGNKFATTTIRNIVNVVMSDYDNTLEKEHILSNMDKEFTPQPGMLAHWAEKHGFEQIEQKGTKLEKADVQDKYVLTYYTPFAVSCAKRTTDDITDTTNKHWYSHCKSSIYDASSTALYTSNPEAMYNDNQHDATKYVPEDSLSYAIDYKKLGLSREDIEEGFKYQCSNMNIMDPNIQQSIFKMRQMGFSQDEIISLWTDKKVNFADANNVALIETHMKEGGKKDTVANLKFTNGNPEYNYNVQDYSCAIRPTAPILFATEAKINREKLNSEQANKVREDIGLYNVYDEKNYGKINKAVYNDYKSHCINGAKKSLSEMFSIDKNWQDFKKAPLEYIGKKISNGYHIASWATIKTLRYIPEAAEVVCNECEELLKSITKVREDNRNKVLGLMGISKDNSHIVRPSVQREGRCGFDSNRYLQLQQLKGR